MTGDCLKLLDMFRRGPATPEDSTNPFAWTYVTNAFGDPTQVTDPNHAVRSRVLNEDRLAVTVTEPAVQDNASRARTYSYDAADRLVETDEANQVIQQSTYWPNGALRAQTQNGSSTSYAYDATGLLSSVTDPNNNNTTYGYDDLGNLKSRQNPGGNCAANPATGCVTYTNDLSGELAAGTNLTAVSYSDGGATRNISNISYDPVGRRTGLTHGSATDTWTFDSLGRLTNAKDEASITTGYGWDNNGNLTKIAYPGGSCVTPVSKCVTRGYDDASRWTSVTDWNNKTTNFSPDADGNYNTYTYNTDSHQDVDVFNFDNADRLIGNTTQAPAVSFQEAGQSSPLGTIQYDRYGGGELKSSTSTGAVGSTGETYGYDGGDRLCWTAPASPTPTNACPGSAPSNSSTYSYDNSDNVTKLANGQTENFDPANQLCFTAPAGHTVPNCTTPSDGYATKYGYDNRGNRLSANPPQNPGTGAAQGNLASTYGYNQDNQMTSAVLPTHQGNQGEYHPISPTRAYDSRTDTNQPGPFTSSQHPAVNVTGGAIPTDGTVAAVALTLTVVGGTATGDATVWADGTTRPAVSNINWTSGQTISNSVVSAVSSAGKVDVQSDGTGTVQYVLDVAGWWSQPNGTAGGTFFPITPTRIIDTRTGPYGTPTSHIAANSATTFTTSVNTWAAQASLTLNVTVTNTSAPGSVAALPGGTSTSPPPSTSNINFTSGQTIAGLVVVKLDANKNFEIYNASSQPIDVIIDEFGYTDPGENAYGNDFTAITPFRQYNTCPSSCTPLNAGTTTTVAFNAYGTLPWNGITAVSINVTANGPTGNGGIRLSAGHTGTATFPATSNLNYTAGYTIANAAIVQLAPDGTLDVSVDGAATNVIIDVTGYYTAATATWTYTYGANGLRQTKTGPPCNTIYGVTTTYAYGADTNLLQESSPGCPFSSKYYYIYGPGGAPLEQLTDDPTATLYIHHDQLGSTRLLTNHNGDYAQGYIYDAYGNLAGSNPWGANTNLRYTGQYHDNETGFYYLRARYYDPATASFMTRDPLNAATRSAYGYTGNNPLNGTDPSGLICFNPTDLDCLRQWAQVSPVPVPDPITDGQFQRSMRGRGHGSARSQG